MINNFDWNIGKIKTVKIVNGNQTVIEMSPKEIIAEPNRHRVESILHALCICVNQLIRLQEVSALKTELPVVKSDEATQ